MYDMNARLLAIEVTLDAIVKHLGVETPLLVKPSLVYVGGWMVWDGTSKEACPVDPHAMIAVKTCASAKEQLGAARSFNWKRTETPQPNNSDEVIAYRLLRETPK